MNNSNIKDCIENNKKILALIPARGGSKGVPRKNIKELSGKPLIAYTIEAAKNSKYINRVVVSTEDEEIAEVSREWGAEIPFIRLMDLAGDRTPTNDVILHALRQLEENEGYMPDYICLLQCTSPLRDSSDIDGTIEKLMGTDFDAALSVCEASCNPYWANVIKEGRLEYFLHEGKNITRRQDLPKVYQINGAVYVVKTSVFIEKKTLEPENMTGYVMTEEASIDIDTKLDFKIAEFILEEKAQGKEERT